MLTTAWVSTASKRRFLMNLSNLRGVGVWANVEGFFEQNPMITYHSRRLCRGDTT